MSEQKTLITVASWEERFKLGTERIIQTEPPVTILMFYYREYAERSRPNRDQLKALCSARSIEIREIEVSFDPVQAWRKYDETMRSYQYRTTEVLFDFTTAPREAIWTLLYLLTRRSMAISYVYHTPESYNRDWLSRDPGEPRLMIKMSGLQDLRRPTILIILTGFDPDRTAQLVTFYEPKLTLLGTQTGGQYSNLQLNIEKHDKVLRSFADIESFEIDVYGDDHGLATLESKVVRYRNDGNLIMSALGPKPSAIALFKLWMKYPETALAYAPSNEYNENYSKGIGQRIVTGRL